MAIDDYKPGALSPTKNSKADKPIPTKIRINRRTGEFTVTLSLDHQSIIDAAKQIIARKFKRQSVRLTKPERVKDFLLLNMATFEREVFACLFLDNDHRLIHFEPLFYGSINSAHINPREVIKQALAHSAAAVIVAHNHPSGNCKPSRADELMTYTLQKALSVSEIRLLDHFIVGSKEVLSMAERGLLHFDKHG
jgi:DNA repair protein RadC